MGRSVGFLKSQAVALLFATAFLFGSVAVLNSLHLKFFYYQPRLIDVSLIDPLIDILVWAISAAAISILVLWLSIGQPSDYIRAFLSAAMLLAALMLPVLSLSASSSSLLEVPVFLLNLLVFVFLWLQSKKPNNERWVDLIASTLTYLFAYLIVIEAATSAFYVTRSFNLESHVGSVDAAIELQLTYAGYGAIPWLYAAFLFSWTWVPLAVRFFSLKSRFRQSSIDHQTSSASADTFTAPIRWKERYLQRLMDPRLFLAFVVAVFVGYYPYFHGPPWLVGTDAYWRYFDPLTRISSFGGGGFVEALAERHPIPLMILYGLHLISQTSLFEMVRTAPILLIILLGLTTWWFLGAKSDFESGLIVFILSALSIVTTIGMYSGILANWMFLDAWMFFFAYTAYRGDRGFRLRDFSVLLSVSTLLLLLHPWSWGMFAAATFLVAFGALLVIGRKSRGILGPGMLLGALLVDIAFAIASLIYLAPVQGWRIADTLSYYSVAIQQPSTLLFFWGSVQWLTQFWSPFFSPLYLAVSIIGVFRLHDSNLTPWRKVLVYSWIMAAGLGSVIAAPIGFDPARAPSANYPELWRVLFLTPFQLTAPLGVNWLAGITVRPRDGHVPNQSMRISNILVVAPVGIGLVLALSPNLLRLILLIPSLALFFILKMGRGENNVSMSALARSMFLYWFLLVTFNFTLRGLSQLLLDPHIYRPQP